MSSFMFHAMLNPRISEADLIVLLEKDTDNKIKVIEKFSECASSIEDPVQRCKYITTCLPILISFIF